MLLLLLSFGFVELYQLLVWEVHCFVLNVGRVAVNFGQEKFAFDIKVRYDWVCLSF